MPRENQREFLAEVLLNNEAAIEFIELLGEASQLIDDLYDEELEPEVRKDYVERVAFIALGTLPSNLFYLNHLGSLLPLVRAGIIDWIDANKLQQQKDTKSRQLAYVLRDTLSSIVIHVAGIVGGHVWMKEQSMRIRRHIYEESFKEFTDSLAKEAA